MSVKSYPNCSIWPRAEPFTYGIFQVNPHPRLAVHNIKKLISYTKSKTKLGFPKLTYSIWKHVACNKLQLSEELAFILFYTCMTMSTYNMGKLKDAEERIHSAAEISDDDRTKGSLTVDLFTFVIFIYIQQINKISLRASAVSANAEWPGCHNRSSELESGRSTPIRPCRNLDEQFHFQFISENLVDLLGLLVEPDMYHTNSLDAAVSEDAVDALSLILEGSVDHGRSLNVFSDLVRIPSISSAVGYSKTNKSFPLRGLYSWLRSCLSTNPFSVETCIRNGRRLQWRLPHQSCTETGSAGTALQQQDSARRQKIATNAHQIPPSAGRIGNKLVIMSMISRQIIARSSATLDGATLKIHRAHCSYLYLLSPMRSVTLDKCRKLTIVLGPVENTLQLNHCEDCLVISACRRAVLVACRRCTLHLCTPSRPVLIQSSLPGSGMALGGNSGSAPSTPVPSAALSGNEEILLAPFHTTYTRLADHMARVNLSVKVNYWDKPFILGQQDSNRQESSRQLPNGSAQPGRGRIWDLLLPCHFYPFNIPLLLPGRAIGETPTTAPTTTGDESAGEPTGVTGRDRKKSLPTKCSLDLSASLVTDASPCLTGEGHRTRAEAEYMAMAASRLVIPLPPVYLAALRERALVYQMWPQHIAGARLNSEQRQVFGSLVDQRFRKWLFESGNLRQLQLLELSTSQNHNHHHQNNNNNNQWGAGTQPPNPYPPTSLSADGCVLSGRETVVAEQGGSAVRARSVGCLHERHMNGTPG